MVEILKDWWVLIVPMLLTALSILTYLRANKPTLARCTHYAVQRGIVDTKERDKKTNELVEVQRVVAMQTKENEVDYCIDCFQDMIIPCAVCGSSIMPGSFIFLAPLNKKTNHVPSSNSRVLESDLTYGQLQTLEDEGVNTGLADMHVVACTRDQVCQGEMPNGRWESPGIATFLGEPDEMLYSSVV